MSMSMSIASMCDGTGTGAEAITVEGPGMLSMGSGGIVYVHRASTTYSQKYFLTIQSKRRTVHSVHGASQLRDRVAHVGEVLIVHHTYSG